MRGYFLFVIIIDHLQRFPNGYDLLTGRGELWVSVAEGFFFISGLVLALVRQRTVETQGWRSTIIKIWKRAAQLYAISVILTVALTYVAFAIGPETPGVKGGVIGHTGFLEIAYNALTLKYIYGWADFLPHYAVFLLGAPLILWLLKRGLWWIVVLGSTAIWFTGNGFNTKWQILFYGGMIAGYYLPSINNFYRQMKQRTRNIITVLIVSLAASTILASAVLVHVRSLLLKIRSPIGKTLDDIQNAILPYVNKEQLPLLRIALFILWFTALYWLFKRYQHPITQKLGWFLAPLGQQSLSVYVVHSLVIYGATVIFPHPAGLVTNFIIATLVLAIIWFATVLRRPARP